MPSTLLLLTWDMLAASAASALASVTDPAAMAMMEWLLADCNVDDERIINVHAVECCMMALLEVHACRSPGLGPPYRRSLSSMLSYGSAYHQRP